MQKTIIFFADASPQMGTGHVMRTLALCRAAAKNGMNVILASDITVPWLQAFVTRNAAGVTRCLSSEQGQEFLASAERGCVVYDGYHFDIEKQKLSRQRGHKVIVIDDYAHLPEYSCDILVNPNPGANEYKYNGEINQKLMGSSYAILRQEFLAGRRHAMLREIKKKPRKLLFTLGGGNFIDRLEHLIGQISGLNLTDKYLRVIRGDMPESEIENALLKIGCHAEVLERVDNMAELLLDTDLCVSAAGGTCWELCCMGTPFLTLEVAENQHDIVKWLSVKGIAPRFSPDVFQSLLFNENECQKLSSKGLNFIDGLGTERIIRSIAGILG